MLDSLHIGSVADSKDALLAEIGDAPDLTFVRGLGNIGDELIFAGTRQLLSGHVYREIGIDDLGAGTGGTAVLSGGGAFSRAYNEYMPEALAVAEQSFDRVIVLPSSFDVSVDRVRTALLHTRATVFAREHESYRRIAGMCRARQAHDCAFFFDYAAYRGDGAGTLNAFRTDLERAGAPLPADNDDISVTCATLDAWLAALARHELVRTDRAHVMIAAALMGKQVEFASCSYFKVDALAAALRDFPVRPLAPGPPPAATAANDDDDGLAAATRARLHVAAPAPPPPAPAQAQPRVTAVILTRDQPQRAARAVRSVAGAGLPAGVLLVAQNPGEPMRRALAEIEAAEEAVQLCVTERDVGCAAGRQSAIERVDTEFVLLLDDDAELIPGALEHLVADLDDHPDAVGVTALVVYEDGVIHHFGGSLEVSDELVTFGLDGAGRAFDGAAPAPTGPSGWAPGTAALFRTAAFDDVPLDGAMATYFEDNEWCHRVERRRPASFRRCREAIAMHARPVQPSASAFIRRAHAVRTLAAHARFYRTHGLVLDTGLFDLVPELRRPGGVPDLAAARLLLELIADRGTDWALAQWCSGGLAPLLDGAYGAAARLRVEIEQVRAETDLWRTHAGNVEVRVRELETVLAGCEQQVTSAQAERVREREQLAWLRERARTLALIEQGGWWRLRGRVLPVLHLAGRLRRRAGR